MAKYDKTQNTDKTEIKFPNIGSDLLQKWNINCNNKNNDSKVGNFLKSTITNSPTGHSGATSLPPISNSFMYIETISINHGVTKECLLALNRLILYKLVIIISIMIDFQF